MRCAALCLLLVSLAATSPGQGWVWWEGERTEADNFRQRSWFQPQNEQERAVLSGGAWLCSEGERGADEVFARYRVTVPAAGTWQLWTRKFWKHGPFRWRFDDGPWRVCGPDVALADSAELRQHVGANWVHLGECELAAGERTFELRLLCGQGEPATACFDAFLLIDGPFYPRGRLKPGERSGAAEEGWWAFEPALDDFEDALLDLRPLNEGRAGEGGFVKRRGGDLVTGSGRPVRFWAVNVGPGVVRMDRSSARYLARRLAKVGVNLVRIHGAVFDAGADDPTAVDPAYLDQLHGFVAALAEQGIYSALSFYFPLWFKARASYDLGGYADGEVPFALLFFDERMQAIHRAWARALLTTDNPYTGRPLGQDPAVAMVELLNEDSFFFWTFDPKRIPDAPRAELERRFGEFRRRRRGGGPDRETLLSAWHMTRDGLQKAPGEREKVEDQVRFLAELQRDFYARTRDFLRGELGCRALVSCSNWHVSDPALLDSLERWTYTVGDVIDKHGYFGGRHEGPRASYAVSVGDCYEDRAAVREPGALPLRCHQVRDFPQMISEIGWPAPNRFKVEMPFLCSAYGALQGIDAFCFFAVGSAFWDSSPVKFPVALPTVLGQFPAAALLYRLGYVEQPAPVAQEALRLEDLFALQGSEAVQEQNLDALRAADVKQRVASAEDPRLHPLAFYVGPVQRRFGGGSSKFTDLSRFVDAEARRVRSRNGQLDWDWGRGVVTVDAPQAQGAVGFLGAAGTIALGDLELTCANEFASVLAVPLDDLPLARSARILFQVGTEERFTGWRAPGGRIEQHGTIPIQVRDAQVRVSLRGRARAATLTTLDANGKATGTRTLDGAAFELPADALYAILSRGDGVGAGAGKGAGEEQAGADQASQDRSAQIPALGEFNPLVVEVLGRYPTDGTHRYHWPRTGSWKGCTQDLEYGGVVFAAGDPEGRCYCCGLTFEVFLAAYRLWCERAGRPWRIADLDVDGVRRLQTQWFGSAEDRSCIHTALVANGLGVRVTDWETARPGDFVQLWRQNGSGHSVVFLGWVRDEQAGPIVGLRYWSTQGATNGIGERAEYFDDRGGNKRVRRDQFWLCRVGAASGAAGERQR